MDCLSRCFVTFGQVVHRICNTDETDLFKLEFIHNYFAFYTEWIYWCCTAFEYNNKDEICRNHFKVIAPDAFLSFAVQNLTYFLFYLIMILYFSFVSHSFALRVMFKCENFFTMSYFHSLNLKTTKTFIVSYVDIESDKECVVGFSALLHWIINFGITLT